MPSNARAVPATVGWSPVNRPLGFGFAVPGRQTGKNDHKPGDLPYVV